MSGSHCSVDTNLLNGIAYRKIEKKRKTAITTNVYDQINRIAAMSTKQPNRVQSQLRQINFTQTMDTNVRCRQIISIHRCLFVAARQIKNFVLLNAACRQMNTLFPSHTHLTAMVIFCSFHIDLLVSLLVFTLQWAELGNHQFYLYLFIYTLQQ